MSAADLIGWERLRHGGLLLDPARTRKFADEVRPPVGWHNERELRQQLASLPEKSSDISAFARFVLEELCGFTNGNGNREGFAAATLHRGRHETYLVPTTVMALADVVVGSKTGVNIHPAGRPLKHTIGAYHNPTAVWVDRRFIAALGIKERLRGLSECLKHGLLQDERLSEDVLTLIASNASDDKLLFDVAMRTMDLKSRVLRADPFEEHVGRILLFGHLHAHSIERALGLRASHGDCVYLGLLVELYLTSGGRAIFDKVSMGLQPLRESLFGGFCLPNEAALESAYSCDPSDRYKEYDAIVLNRVGQYRDPSKTELVVQRVRWLDIWAALGAARLALGLPTASTPTNG